MMALLRHASIDVDVSVLNFLRVEYSETVVTYLSYFYAQFHFVNDSYQWKCPL